MCQCCRRQVLVESLYDDVLRAVLTVLRRSLPLVALSPLLFPLHVLLVTFGYVGKHVFYWFIHQSLTRALLSYQRRRDIGFAIHPINIPELNSMQMGAYPRPYRLFNHRLIIWIYLRRHEIEEFWHTLRSLGHHTQLSVDICHSAACCLAVSHQLQFLLLSQSVEHLLQLIRHSFPWFLECTINSPTPFINGKTVIPWNHSLKYFLRVIAYRPQKHADFECPHVPVAHTRLLAVVEHIPVFLDDGRVCDALIG